MKAKGEFINVSTERPYSWQHNNGLPYQPTRWCACLDLNVNKMSLWTLQPPASSQTRGIRTEKFNLTT